MAPIFRPYSWSPWGTIIYTRSMKKKKKKKKKKRRRRAVKEFHLKQLTRHSVPRSIIKISLHTNDPRNGPTDVVVAKTIE